LCRIVGEDDHGVTFTPEQYEEYKRRVIPMVSSYCSDENWEY